MQLEPQSSRLSDIGFSDNEGDDDHEQDDNAGDYSARMEELFDDTEDEDGGRGGIGVENEDDEDIGGFVYSGADAEVIQGTYKQQLRDVLGPDHDGDDELEERNMNTPFGHEVEGADHHLFTVDGILHVEVLSDNTPSTPSPPASFPLTPPRMSSPLPNSTPSKLAKPFLHPTVSRLRSYTPQASRLPSVSSMGTIQSNAREAASPEPSHFSALSPMSSTTNLRAGLEKQDMNGPSQAEREGFRWMQLRKAEQYLFTNTPQKASALLGSPVTGAPRVIAANGLICIGTDTGQIHVFDFKQNLKCTCGDAESAQTVGPVTALALSHDHTFVATGHAFGHIQVFDLNKPQKPVRFVPPTSRAAVASGRKEGHINGSRIVNIGFVAGRHTAIVSADENGLAFYHSLGKVLFVDASDVLRILGKYPEEEPPPPTHLSQSKTNGIAAAQHPRRRKARKVNTILAMAPLPLGTTPHPTDGYNIVALLTAAKLVIVGLKPSPRTWYRRHRDEDDELARKSKFRGSMAWFPSIVLGGASPREPPKKGKKEPAIEPTIPMLVYSWGPTLNLLRVSEIKVKETVVDPRTNKSTSVEVGRLTFQEAAKWSAQDDVLAIQWLNANQIVVVTSSALEVYDIQTLDLVEHTRFDAASLISPTLGYTSNGTISYSDSLGDIAHSVRTYKGKVFLLCRNEVRAGTLLTWADRILSFVHDGDFLSAIDLARAYYLGKAPGNKNGLPDNPQQLRQVTEQKMRELMVASTRYAFSEDRMMDATHYTPDGRGVDRTSFFENLVSTCARACIALDDFEFLFEDLFQAYDDVGITRIYLKQLEVFVLDNDIRYVPPRITQRLIDLHKNDYRADLAERVIWHIDPECLDINQAIHLCREYQLYDALIYVYTRAMKDYVLPVVEMLGLIRKVMQYRRDSTLKGTDEVTMEPVVMNAYKVYPYLADALTGLTYPSEEPLNEEEALQAKHDVYTFIFFGRSSVWPLQEGGKLVLTAEEEGGVEPTYPYCRLLLRFDAEAFLHSLDIAFEDTYLNDESQGASRLIVIKVLLEILASSPGLSPADITFVNIFIARNVPKYPQFIQIAPSALHNILVGLANDPDETTREDRQLAAEYLLSTYTPDESDRLLRLFEKAKFYRILRSWHRHERQWGPLLLAYLHDHDLPSDDVFDNANEIFKLASSVNQGILPLDLITTISDSLPDFMQASIINTAFLVDNHVPQLHARALEALGPSTNHRCFAYLHCLLGPPSEEDEGPSSETRHPSKNVPPTMRQLYLSLQCQIDATNVIPTLQHFPPEFVPWNDIIRICEEHNVCDAVVWALNRQGTATESIRKVEIFSRRLVSKIAQELVALSESQYRRSDLQEQISSLKTLGRMAVSVCLEHSRSKSGDIPVEELWFQLLRSQIDSVQAVSGCCSSQASSSSGVEIAQRESMFALRALIQETFSSLVSVSSSRGVSFPRLFTRLVDSTSHTAKGTPYTEFRTILTSMMESYRSEGDILTITKHLFDRDVFETVEMMTKERAKGWAPLRGTCTHCRSVLTPAMQPSALSRGATEDKIKIIVSRTGAIYHSTCLPSDFLSNTVH